MRDTELVQKLGRDAGRERKEKEIDVVADFSKDANSCCCWRKPVFSITHLSVSLFFFFFLLFSSSFSTFNNLSFVNFELKTCVSSIFSCFCLKIV